MTRAEPCVLVSDFDGTMTHDDFYKLAIDHLLPDDVPDFWSRYRAGEISHFEALRLYFASIRRSQAEVLEVVRQMQLDATLPQAVMKLNTAGWRVVIASAGCRWYISYLLGDVEQQLEVHANPGRFVEGQGLVMELPRQSPYFCEQLGIDKCAVVRGLLDQRCVVAFAGDGFPDFEAARLVRGELRFARGDLARVLDEQRLPYRRFGHWSEIADCLCGMGDPPC